LRKEKMSLGKLKTYNINGLREADRDRELDSRRPYQGKSSLKGRFCSHRFSVTQPKPSSYTSTLPTRIPAQPKALQSCGFPCWLLWSDMPFHFLVNSLGFSWPALKEYWENMRGKNE